MAIRSELTEAIEIKRVITEFLGFLSERKKPVCARYDIGEGPFKQVQYCPLNEGEKHGMIMEFLKELGFKIPSEEEIRAELQRLRERGGA